MTAHHTASPTADFRTTVVLVGELVMLRQLTGDDAPALLPMLEDEETARLTGSRLKPPIAELARSWYGSRPDQHDRLDLAIVDRATDDVVGEAVLHEWDEDNESCSFRICLVPGRYGRGLGTEATRLIVGYAFEELALHRVSLGVFAINPRARRTYEKVGFVTEGVLRDELRWGDERIDSHIMSILAEEWAQHRGYPESR